MRSSNRNPITLANEKKRQKNELTEAGVFVDQKALVITPELYHVKKHIVNGA
jgi:hypothetical protein